MDQQQKPTSGRFKKFIIALVVILVLAIAATGITYYLKFFGPNVTDSEQYLYIKTGSTFEDVYQTVRDKDMVNDTTTFAWAAQNMKYVGRVKPGRYRLDKGMSNRALINRLKSGSQEAVKVVIKNYRLKNQFMAYISTQIEPDSVTLLNLIDSASYVEKYGFTTDNVYTMFMPNSYDFFWNISADKFFEKMYGYYQNFWTPERKAKAEAINLTPQQVSVLASIVDAEALHDDEMPVIAGLYLNRLNKGQKLQADPTVIFAMHDFTIKRVLNRYLLTNSPYNTYMYAGLPPGPVMMPSVNAVNAVLDHQKNNYIYMCAKEDFSGYHNFAVTEAEHLVNARKFQQALNDRNIKK